MASIDDILAEMRRTPGKIRFAEAVKVCEHFFERRKGGGSHVAIFRMPWPGDPRINLQEGENGTAKAYQVRQAVQAIDKLAEMQKGGGNAE